MEEKSNRARSHLDKQTPKNYVCPICNGTGFVDKGDKVELCICRFEGEDIGKALHIPKRFYHASLKYFEAKSIPQYEALAECVRYAKNFNLQDGKGLSIVGPSGVGKTYLACAVLKEIYLTKGVRGLFFDTRDMLSKLRYYLDDHEKHRKLLNVLLKVPLLVLDDLGNEMLSDWNREHITYILIYRYNNLKSTIITTRYFLNEEAENSLYERLSDSVVNKIKEMNKSVFIKE